MSLVINFLRNPKAKTILGLTAIVGIGLGSYVKFVAVPSAATAVLNYAKDKYRMDITVEGWSFDLIDLTATARNVKWNTNGRFSRQELFKADTIVARLDSSKILSLKPDFLGAIKEIDINDPTIVIENKNGNRWNWESTLNSRDILRGASEMAAGFNNQSKPSFNISAVNLKELSVVWIEELPANSGNGRIQHLRSELHIDDAQVVLNDLQGFVQQHDRPMRIDFDGRTADGIIKVSGELNPFWWQPEKAGTGASAARGASTPVSWTPYISELTVYLENVNADAIGDMIPDSILQAKGGTMSGQVIVSMDEQGLASYEVEMNLNQVQWALNEHSSKFEQRTAIKEKAALASYVKTGTIRTSSKGRISDPNFRLIPSMQTAITRVAVNDAPDEIRRRAVIDQRRYEDPVASPALAQLNEIERTLKTVNDVARQANSVAQTVNTATQGLNQIQRSLGGIFRRSP